ncbi:MAG: DNA helicase UvrBC, partial [Treponema sp.]|nr:DNA helicase UvrBC [Treponema sp.]
MLCDFCKEREAVIFLEQMSGNGQKRKINMCAECAIDRGISSDPRSIEASIGDLFKELANLSRKAQRESRRMCPVCGLSVGEIRKKGLVGCPECYAIFKDDIRKYIMGKGIKGVYTGS